MFLALIMKEFSRPIIYIKTNAMNENKVKNQHKVHDVETPSPPQVMDPSKSPQRGESENETGTDKGNSSKSKKKKDRKPSANEEL